jgi:ubiquinone/menaquinone biosynthesis C-methylase UbiE
VIPHQSLVRAQFDRQVAHYLAGSAMADRAILAAVVAAAPPPPGGHVLDVACGAGFLLAAYRDAGAAVTGVDLSDAMLRAARETLGPSLPPGRLVRADAADLPFPAGSFDVIACKLALHYFPEPTRVVAEMARVCKQTGLIALVDRVAVDDPALAAAHNRLEKLRTPNKVRVYTEAEVRALVESAGLAVVRRELLIQPMRFDEWMAAAGAADRSDEARALLAGAGGEDLTGLDPRTEGGELVVRHRTLILVAARP